MEVTLYKGCMLNKSYSEVFRTSELLDTYLATLTKKTYTINPINVSKSGYIKLVVSNDSDSFLYNYMKIDTGENTVPRMIVYAFIDSIYSENEVMVYEYDTDVWHTYLERNSTSKWSLRKSLVTNTRRTISGEPLEKPLPYIFNPENADIEGSVDDVIIGSYHIRFNIILKIQLYRLTSGGEYEKMNFEGYVGLDNNYISDFRYKPTKADISNLIDDIVFRQSEDQWSMTLGETIIGALYCRIVDFIVLPAEWHLTLDYSSYTIQSNGGYCYSPLKQSIEIKNLNSFIIEATDGFNEEDIKISYGIWSNQFNYEFDGVDKNSEIIVTLDGDELHLYFRVNGLITEITDQFRIYQDYQPQTPDVLAQREIARKQATIQGIVSTVDGAARVGLSLAGIPTISGSSSGSKLLKGADKLAKFNQPEAISISRIGKSMNYGSELAGISKVGSGSISGISEMVEGISSIIFANKAKYMSFQPTNNYSVAITNAYYGICILKITYDENTINDYIPNFNEVNKMIEEIGFNVDYVTDDLDIRHIQNETIMVNPIKFSFVRVAGLSTELNNEIADILLNGTKIYYELPE